MIDTAVIFAAGQGRRLGSLGREVPKPLLSVGGRPLIVRIIEGFARAGIERFAVITGHLAHMIETELGNGAQAGVRIDYARQTEPQGTAKALHLARELLPSAEPFAFSWGDIFVPPQNYRRVLSAARFAEGVLAVNEVDDPFNGGAVYVDESSRIVRLVEKPAKGTSQTKWNNAGFGVLPPAIWGAIDELGPSAAGGYELPRAIAALLDSGADFRAVPVEGGWFDIGTPDDLAAAEQAAASDAHVSRVGLN